MGEIGPNAKPAIPALIQLAWDKHNTQDFIQLLVDKNHPDLRSNADMALVAIGPATATEVPALTQLLDDENPDIRRSATKALSEIEK